MTKNIDSIIDRIQKLLRLAKNAGSEHEAALAAEMAADLMRLHEISGFPVSSMTPSGMQSRQVSTKLTRFIFSGV